MPHSISNVLQALALLLTWRTTGFGVFILAMFDWIKTNPGVICSVSAVHFIGLLPNQLWCDSEVSILEKTYCAVALRATCVRVSARGSFPTPSPSLFLSPLYYPVIIKTKITKNTSLKKGERNICHQHCHQHVIMTFLFAYIQCHRGEEKQY